MTKRSKLVEEVVRLTKIVEEQATKNSQLTKIVEEQKSELIEQSTKSSNLSKEVDKLKAVQAAKGADGLSKVVAMSSGLVDIGVDRTEADFEYELCGLNAFLKSNESRPKIRRRQK